MAKVKSVVYLFYSADENRTRVYSANHLPERYWQVVGGMFRKNMVAGLYIIENKVNGKRYIGSSINIESRLWHHRSELNRNVHPNGHLQHAWNKYGEDIFEFKIFVITDPENAVVLEDFILKHYIEHFEYNIALDATAPMLGRKGKKSPNWGKHRSAETISKISSNHADMSGKNHPNWGKHPNDETRAKISLALSGENSPNWGKTGKNNPCWIELPIDTLRELRAEGASYQQIADMAGCGRETVRRRLTNA